MGKTYTIDIQKALSFPHCVGHMDDGPARCAVGAIFDSIQWDNQRATGSYIHGDEQNAWMDGWMLFPGLIHVAHLNDKVCKDNLQRDILRRKVIMQLIQYGALVPAATDKSLAQELKELAVSCTR